MPFKSCIGYLRVYSLLILTTRPLKARRARAFGITIRPLKKSESSHTSSSFRVEPKIIKAITIREYIFPHFFPNKYSAFIFPKKCHPRIVEKAKKRRHIAMNISPQLPKLVINAVWVRAIPSFPDSPLECRY